MHTQKVYTLGYQCGSPVENGFPEAEEAVEATDWAASRFARSLIGRVTVYAKYKIQTIFLGPKTFHQYVKRNFEMTST